MKSTDWRLSSRAKDLFSTGMSRYDLTDFGWGMIEPLPSGEMASAV